MNGQKSDAQEPGRGITAGGVHHQALRHYLPVRLQGEGRVVIRLGKMRKACPLQTCPFTEELGSLVVGNMSSCTFDAPLESGGIGSLREQYGVVITLDEDGIERGDHLWQFPENMPEVGQYPETLLSVGNHKNRTVLSIVRGREGPDRYFPEREGSPCKEKADIAQFPQVELRFSGTEGAGGDVERNPVFPLVYSRIADVIGMVVRDDHGAHRTDVPSEGSEPARCYGTADAGIEEQAHSVAFHIDAVAVAA